MQFLIAQGTPNKLAADVLPHSHRWSAALHCAKGGAATILAASMRYSFLSPYT